MLTLKVENTVYHINKEDGVIHKDIGPAVECWTDGVLVKEYFYNMGNPSEGLFVKYSNGIKIWNIQGQMIVCVCDLMKNRKDLNCRIHS